MIVGLCLLMMVAGSFGWKMYRLIEKQRFRSSLEQLFSQLSTCHHLSITMQADWKAVLYQSKGTWIFEAGCSDHPIPKKLPKIVFPSMTFLFNDQVLDVFSIDFFSSGTISPQGEMAFYKDLKTPNTDSYKWNLPFIFQCEEGEGDRSLGPIHPDDLQKGK